MNELPEIDAKPLWQVLIGCPIPIFAHVAIQDEPADSLLARAWVEGVREGLRAARYVSEETVRDWEASVQLNTDISWLERRETVTVSDIVRDRP